MKLYEVRYSSFDNSSLTLKADETRELFRIPCPAEWIINKIVVACETNPTLVATINLYNRDIDEDTKKMDDNQKRAYKMISLIVSLSPSNNIVSLQNNLYAVTPMRALYLELIINQGVEYNTKWAVAIAGRVSGAVGL